MAPGRLQPPRRFHLRHVPALGNLRQCLACDLRVRRAPGDGDLYALIHLPQIQRAGAGRVGIAIAARVLLPRAVSESLQHLAASSPVGDARRTSNARSPPALIRADLESLAHGIQNRLRLAAHVRGIDRARRGQRLVPAQHLFRCGRIG